MPARNPSFLRRHSLSIASGAVVLLCFALYGAADPATHTGAFLGNAIADWTGVVVTILATKHLYERKGRTKLPPGSSLSARLHRTAHNHSLTLFLFVTGVAWVVLYVRLNAESKWGQVTGSLVSEWTQTLGMVLMAKWFIERKAPARR